MAIGQVLCFSTKGGCLMSMQHYHDNCHGITVGANEHHQNIPIDWL